MDIFGLSKHPDPVYNFDFDDPNPGDCDDDDCSESLFDDEYADEFNDFLLPIPDECDECDDFNFDDFEEDSWGQNISFS